MDKEAKWGNTCENISHNMEYLKNAILQLEKV